MLIFYYRGSLIAALQDLYPEHEWIPWLFRGGCGRMYWRSEEHRREFFLWLASQKLRLKSPRQWVDITAQQVIENGGYGLLTQHYGGSHIRALRQLFPEHHEQFWKKDLEAKRIFDRKKRKESKYG